MLLPCERFVSLLTDWQAALGRKGLKHHEVAGLGKQLQRSWVHELVCLPCPEPSFLLPLTYKHSYKYSCRSRFGVSMQDTHSPACKGGGRAFLKTFWCLHWALYNKGVVARVFHSVARMKQPALPWDVAPPLAPQVRAGGWGGRGPALPRTFPASQHGGAAFRDTQSHYVLFLLLLPTQETSAASFFSPAQVRPDFPVQITIALFTFHTP